MVIEVEHGRCGADALSGDISHTNAKGDRRSQPGCTSRHRSRLRSDPEHSGSDLEIGNRGELLGQQRSLKCLRDRALLSVKAIETVVQAADRRGQRFRVPLLRMSCSAATAIAKVNSAPRPEKPGKVAPAAAKLLPRGRDQGDGGVAEGNRDAGNVASSGVDAGPGQWSRAPNCWVCFRVGGEVEV